MDLTRLSGLTQTRLTYNIKIESFKHSDQKLFLWERLVLFHDENNVLLRGITS